MLGVQLGLPQKQLGGVSLGDYKKSTTQRIGFSEIRHESHATCTARLNIYLYPEIPTDTVNLKENLQLGGDSTPLGERN